MYLLLLNHNYPVGSGSATQSRPINDNKAESQKKKSLKEKSMKYKVSGNEYLYSKIIQ